MKVTLHSFTGNEDNHKIGDQWEENCSLSGQHGITSLL